MNHFVETFGKHFFHKRGHRFSGKGSFFSVQYGSGKKSRSGVDQKGSLSGRCGISSPKGRCRRIAKMR